MVAVLRPEIELGFCWFTLKKCWWQYRLAAAAVAAAAIDAVLSGLAASSFLVLLICVHLIGEQYTFDRRAGWW